MCDVYDVLEASEKSASTITTVSDFGNGSLGEGIRRFAREAFCVGVQEGYEYGYHEGYLDGMFKGTILTITAFSVFGVSAWAICKYKENQKVKDKKKEDLKERVTKL